MFDLDGYLTRIGYHCPRERGLEVLNDILALHPGAITFEAFDPLTGKVPDLDPEAIDAKLIGARRGGCCFEQNSLLLRASHALGFAAEGMIGRVWWMRPPNAEPGVWSHMSVRVRLGGRDWLADAGFGTCVTTCALDFGTSAPQKTAHERFRLRPTEDGWMLKAELGKIDERDDPWARVYEVRRSLPEPGEYVRMNEVAATASHFASPLILARTTPQERIVLAGNRLTRRSRTGILERTELDVEGIEVPIRTRLRLPLSDMTTGARPSGGGNVMRFRPTTGSRSPRRST